MSKILVFLTLILSVSISSLAAGFHTSGQKLLDANNNEFIMRGCNYSYAWQRGHESTVIPAAKRIGCNTIRIQLSTGARWQKCSADDLRRLIQLCEDNKLVAVFNTHDETGSNNVGDLLNAVNYWIEMKDILNAHASTVIVNISNEWYGDWNSSAWANGYKQAIPLLRNAGIKNTLMVDAAGWGQFPKCIQQNGADVIAADSQNNTIFSLHIYDDAGKTDATARTSIDYALAAGVPAVVGEFAYEHNYTPVAYQTVMDYCTQKGVGYLVWSWTGNGGNAQNCDMFGSYDDSIWKNNATYTVKGSNGIQATSKECSVFSSSTPAPGPDDNSGSSGTPAGETTVSTPNIFISAWTDDPYVIPASAFKNASASDELRIYYNARSGAEIQLAYCDSYNDDLWTNLIDYKSISGSGVESQSLSSILPHVKKSGFFVKGHDFTITKVTLVTKDSAGGDSGGGSTSGGSVWKGNANLSNWDNLEIPSSYTKHLVAGDNIIVHFTVNSGASVGNMVFKDGSWNEIESLKESATNLGEWGVWYSGTTSTRLTLDAAAAKAIASTGFIITGLDVTVTKVEFGIQNSGGSSSGGSSASSWSGNSDLGNWDNLIIPASYTKDLLAGSKIEISFSVNSRDDYGNMTFKDGSWNEIESLKNSATNMNEWKAWPRSATSTVLTLDAAAARALASTGFIISGYNVTVTKVVFNSASLGIDEIETSADAPVEYYNLQGIRVSEPAAGNIYIRRQGSTLTKIRY